MVQDLILLFAEPTPVELQALLLLCLWIGFRVSSVAEPDPKSEPQGAASFWWSRSGNEMQRLIRLQS
jgi:hypothetical protein